MSEPLQTLLQRSADAGIYHLPHGARATLRDAAQALGYTWLQTDFGEQREIVPILEQIGRDLQLPAWYGANYDALADCLCDPDCIATAPGYVLLVSGADELHAQDNAAFDTLNEVLAGVVATWRDDGTPFWVFYDMRPDGLAPLPTLAAA